MTDVSEFEDRVALNIKDNSEWLTLVATRIVRTVYCVELVNNIRIYLRLKVRKQRINDYYVEYGLRRY